MSMRDIKRRIKSVRNIRQITKAMGLVSATKVQKAKRIFEDTRAFFSELELIAENFPSGIYSATCDKQCVVMISSDRGLCGAYNINIVNFAINIVRSHEENILIAFGNCGTEIAKRKNVVARENFSCNPDDKSINKISEMLIDYYKNGYEICLAYTKFYSAMRCAPVEKKILPLNKIKSEFIFDPDPKSVGDYFVRKYVSMSILNGLIESSLCEQNSRMLSMNAATDNAESIISELNLKYNRLRQNQVTQELTEIISGAEALKN